MATAGPSNPRKRTQKQRDTSGSIKPPTESFGTLELAKELDSEEGSVDEDYSEDEDDDEAFPEIDDGSEHDEDDSEAGDDDEEDDDELSEDEQILRELAEEEELERDLADTSDSSFSDDDDIDENDPDALDHAIRKATSKPEEDFELDDTAATQLANNELLGFDTRPFKDRAMVGKSAITGEERRTWKEIEPIWEEDEGAEEGANRVGKIPEYFYDGMPHVGYDINGKKVLRPVKGDELDKFLANIEDPSSWTSVEDKLLQKNVQLTDQELDLIQRLAKAENPDANYEPYEPTIEWFTGKGKEMATPLTRAPEPKRRFIPSKWEHKKVMKIVRAIRQGRITPHGPNKAASEKPQFYGIWSASDEPLNMMAPMHMPAPKMKLPGHEESYNPPAEYLFSKDELKEWEEADPSDRKLNFIPQKHDSLRRVPGYNSFMQERFDRQLDLYLAPRAHKRKPKVLEGVTKPEDLLPKLPDPKELRPFPVFCSITYEHPGSVRVRCLSIDPTGNWLITGADDGIVRLWELRRGKCLLEWKLDTNPIQGLEWCPDKEKPLFAAVTENTLNLLSPLDLLSPAASTDILEYVHSGFSVSSENLPTLVDGVKWSRPSSTDSTTSKNPSGLVLIVTIPGTPKQVTWHRRGDYLTTVASDAGTKAVLMHQITKHSTQAPFKRAKGAIQRVAFHPTRPHFLLATERYVRIYDLMAQSLVKTLQPGVKHVSSLDVHPMGDNVIVGSYDRRLVWHDLDLSDRPYKTLRYHPRAIRSVQFSTRFPLFLSTSDDGTVQVFHSTVYSDLVTNPLIVPLKVLRGHGIVEGLGVLDAKFHPKEPWIVSAGADGTARLWM